MSQFFEFKIIHKVLSKLTTPDELLMNNMIIKSENDGINMEYKKTDI